MLQEVFLLLAIGALQNVEAMTQREKWLCRNTAFISNGEDLQPFLHNWDDNYQIREVACKYGYQINIKESQNIWFRCEKNGVWEGMLDDLLIRDFTLRNVTCQEKNRCPFRPAYINNGRYYVTQRYCLPLKHVYKCTGTFYSGDRIQYACDRGYKARLIEKTNENSKNEFEKSSYDYGIYGDYGIKKEEEKTYKTPSMEFNCSDRGQWRSDDGVTPPICEEIECNASRFENISNGYIKNFTDTYKYGEMIELVCDRGYRPINNLRVLQCLNQDRLDEIEEFGCKRIECPDPVPPLEGKVRLINRTRYVDDEVNFFCDSFKAKLVGPKSMICLETGEWSSDHCVKCIPEDADCPPPCMHAGSKLLTPNPTYVHGSVIEMTCVGNEDLVINRTCLRNNRWDKSDLHCKGKKDPLKALMVAESLRATMQSLENRTGENETDITGKTIDIGTAGGVDIYFALDVSGSINKDEFDLLKKFTLELVKNVNVSDGEDGTRISLLLFARTCVLAYDGHQTDNQILQDTEEAVREVERALNWTNILDGKLDGIDVRDNEIGKGTNLKAALDEVDESYETKRSMKEIQVIGQQVVVLISDGELNTGGDPTEAAQNLKDKDIQIYSVYVGQQEDDPIKAEKGKQLMQDLASDLPGEEHYFEITPNNFLGVLESMINRSSEIPCGEENPERTKINEIDQVQKKVPAEKHAWPWMVQIKTTQDAYCGGSVIDKTHVLTAAHCFFHPKTKNALTGPYFLYFKSHKFHTQTEDGDNVEEIVVNNAQVTIHPNFNLRIVPRYLYDIALITLEEPLEFNSILRPICLPEDESVWDEITRNKKHGIVTGWGGEHNEVLHQAQMLIPSDEKCTKSIKKGKKKEFNSTVMFCAGGKDDGEVVDSCPGDSGGPFIIEDETKEDHFIQIGIVSFGTEKKCKLDGKYGFYTKLNNDLLDWVHNTIQTEDERIE